MKVTPQQIDEAAVAAVLTFKDNPGATVEELERVAQIVQNALTHHFAWNIRDSDEGH